MLDYGSEIYNWVKVLHIISVITWMAGLFYLPRLYVYHAMEGAGTPTSETFKVMERRLLKGIMNPSIIVVFITGLLLMFPTWATAGWMHTKLLLVLLMAGMHGAYAKWRKDFLNDTNSRGHKFYRWMNEVPTVLLLAIIPLVIFKWF
ncbi:Protoporphyrinogen IX oxidase [Caenispirillum salinarum AK4]|uniref:Protoporphyrinogen IX oxidase n=1 Tax=Caenispirillum salinarum AK4 TaxID=1238182 RepID=K9H521_9PROT|nr:protoporphyrinogen oxidase HemJ [Caenispirillum salinarum]EKV32159.1 Protoporphyrinogen IX oxidase [Caenispirillum salinarum AK4]